MKEKGKTKERKTKELEQRMDGIDSFRDLLVTMTSVDPVENGKPMPQ